MSPTSYQLLHPAIVVDGVGFEPTKPSAADLQSAPFNHSGIRPHGAGNRTRTYDLLITNQLLYQLSYASGQVTKIIITCCTSFVKHFLLVIFVGLHSAYHVYELYHQFLPLSTLFLYFVKILLPLRKTARHSTEKAGIRLLPFYRDSRFFRAMISLMIFCATSDTGMPRFMLVSCMRRCASSSEMP